MIVRAVRGAAAIRVPAGAKTTRSSALTEAVPEPQKPPPGPGRGHKKRDVQPEKTRAHDEPAVELINVDVYVVAGRAQVDPRTVKKYLDPEKRKGMRPIMRRRVAGALVELGYCPDAVRAA